MSVILECVCGWYVENLCVVGMFYSCLLLSDGSGLIPFPIVSYQHLFLEIKSRCHNISRHVVQHLSNICIYIVLVFLAGRGPWCSG